jgi:biotin synthase
MISTEALLDKIANGYKPAVNEIIWLLETSHTDEALIYSTAQDITKRIHGDIIHLRGLIEFSNKCGNNCLYCGIRMGASGVKRYRMSLDEILESAQKIREAGCGTVVLQCGVDLCFTTEDIAKVVKAIKKETGLAITLSVGTKTKKELALLKKAGADRFLLRFETCNETIFNKIHPSEPLKARIECIRHMQELDYQAGSGFMIGLPGATIEDIAQDILFTKIRELDMIGCGPFIPAPGTPLGDESILEDYSIYFKTMALIRIMNPKAHIPAATAFDSLKEDGRDEVIKCGANVFMPNFTPFQYKESYNLYPGKPQVDTSVNIMETVNKRLKNLGRRVGTGAGHALRMG